MHKIDENLFGEGKKEDYSKKLPEIVAVDDMKNELDAIVYSLQGHFKVHAYLKGRDVVKDLVAGKLKRVESYVLDYMMPEMNGEILFKEIREVDPLVPILFLSAYSEEAAPERMHERINPLLQGIS